MASQLSVWQAHLLNVVPISGNHSHLAQSQTVKSLHASGSAGVGLGRSVRGTSFSRLKSTFMGFDLHARSVFYGEQRDFKMVKPSKDSSLEVQASIGFTADPRVSVERAAADLLRDAASLLVYQDVLKRPPAQAFLKVLVALRRSDDGIRILEAYGEFYRLMAQGGHASWEDYVLDGILTGESNPFAESAASLPLPGPGQPPANVPDSLSAAAAYDLDTLQRLSIGETTLSGWVSELVGDIQPHWRKAASQTLGGQNGRHPQAGNTPADETPPISFAGLHDLADNSPTRGGKREKPQPPPARQLGFDLGDMAGPSETEDIDNDNSNSVGGLFTEPARFVNADLFPLNRGGQDLMGPPSLVPPSPSAGAAEAPSEESRDRWRSRIGGMWRWSESVPLLQEYYTRNGTGAVASSTDLGWRKGELILASPPGKPAFASAYGAGYDLTVQRKPRDELLANLERHCNCESAHHVLLEGESGLGKSWIARSAAAEAGCRWGLRTVTLTKADLKSLPAVGAELARFPNLRFLVLVDDLTLRQGDEVASALASALEDNSATWPPNAIFCMTSRASFLYAEGVFNSAASRMSDHIFMFGIVLSFSELTNNEYVMCLQEMAAQAKRADPLAWRPVVDAWKSVVSEEGVSFGEEPLRWARRFGKLSVRLAVRFMKN